MTPVMMIIGRIAASVALIAVFFLVAKSVAALRRRRMQTMAGTEQEMLLAHGARPDQPALLYFWGEGCAQCAPQERQIEEAQKILAASGASLTVVKLNALEEEALASSMRVMTLPTTVVLDAAGHIWAWNPGLTPGRKLAEQLEAVGVAP